jgi:hypothetical protein
VAVQEVRWAEAGSQIFFRRNGDANHHLLTSFFLHMRIISAVKRVEFITDRMPYIKLRGRGCDIIVLNVHAPTENKNDDPKDSFYEKLESSMGHFPKYRMEILLGDFDENVGKSDIFKPIVENESSHETKNDSLVTVANFATSRNIIVKSTVFFITALINTLGLLLMGKHTT